MTENRWKVLIDRDDITKAELVDAKAAELQDGQIEAALRHFAMTANNITYAAIGNMKGIVAPDGCYWDFFPSGAEGKGLGPVWGYGEVVRSKCDGIKEGEMLYGYFPLASHLVMQPGKITDGGFVDDMPHRRELASAYQNYTRLGASPQIEAKERDLMPVFKPLQVTGFCIADQLQDNDYYGAEQIVLASASSKTAMMAARSLNAQEGRPKTIGLTSAANRAYVEGTGLYDQVVTYDGIESLKAGTPTAYVDMAGSGEITKRIHSHFGDALTLSLGVGMSHWQEVSMDVMSGQGLPGPKVTGFFAPGQIQKRAKDWGAQGLQERLDKSWRDAMSIADSLTEIERHTGAKEALKTFLQAARGHINPGKSVIVEVG
ncbi:MAG: DUF2855 family protein [Alphaproteobacteria bacterium]|nr:DUF2855 family protein [Alphaproteobacteria bacterium]